MKLLSLFLLLVSITGFAQSPRLVGSKATLGASILYQPLLETDVPSNFLRSGSSAGGDLTGTYPNPTIKSSVALTGTPTAPTASANTNNTQISTTAYTDAKVVDAIVDGVTTQAASQNAVFDAFALKQDKNSNFYVVSTWSNLVSYVASLSGLNAYIYFPSGAYSATASVVFPSSVANVTVIGENGSVFITNNIAATADIFSVSAATSFYARGIKYNANASTQVEYCFGLAGIPGTVLIENCEFTGFGSFDNGAIKINTSPNNATLPGFRIRNNRFVGTTSVGSGTHDYNAAATKGTGIKIVGGSEYWQVEGNFFTGMNVPIWIGNGANGLVIGNGFTENDPYNLSTTTKYGVIYMEDNATNTGKLGVFHNKFNHNWGFIFKSTSTTQDFPTIFFSGNEVVTNNASAIVLPAIGSGSFITNNIFRTSYVAAATNSPYGTTTDHAIMQLANSNNVIMGNEFWTGTNSQPAILTTGTSNNNLIKNNWVQSTFGTFTTLAGANDNVYFNDVHTLPVINGGTGQNTAPTKGALLVGTGTTSFGQLAVGANDRVPIADSSQPTGIRWATLTFPNGGTNNTGGFPAGIMVSSDGSKLISLGTSSTSAGLMFDNTAGAQFLDVRKGVTTTNTVGTVGRFIQQNTAGSQMADGFGAAIALGYRDVDGVDNVGAGIVVTRTGADNSGTLNFSTNNAGTTTTKLSILPTGEVGIGTTSQNSTLHVNGSMSTAYVSKTALYTLTASDYLVEVTSGTHTQTLPTAVGITGRTYKITNSGTGVVTLGTTSSQTFVNVSGTPTTLTINQFGCVTVTSNGTNWLLTDLR